MGTRTRCIGRRAAWPAVLVLLAATACATDSGDVGVDSLAASCGSVTFQSIPPDVTALPPLDPETQAVFDDFISGPLAVESAFLAEFDMRVAERSENDLLLFGHHADGGYAEVRFERSDDVWTARGWGGCSIVVSAPGFGSAATILDPAVEPDPTSTTLHISIQERACASGQAPTDREVIPVVVETAATIEITTLVEPVTGDTECPSNPWFPMTVDLDEPIGQRTIVDMQSPPGVERTWPPTNEDL